MTQNLFLLLAPYLVPLVVALAYAGGRVLAQGALDRLPAAQRVEAEALAHALANALHASGLDNAEERQQLAREALGAVCKDLHFRVPDSLLDLLVPAADAAVQAERDAMRQAPMGFQK